MKSSEMIVVMECSENEKILLRKIWTEKPGRRVVVMVKNDDS